MVRWILYNILFMWTIHVNSLSDIASTEVITWCPFMHENAISNMRCNMRMKLFPVFWFRRIHSLKVLDNIHDTVRCGSSAFSLGRTRGSEIYEIQFSCSYYITWNRIHSIDAVTSMWTTGFSKQKALVELRYTNIFRNCSTSIKMIYI